MAKAEEFRQVTGLLTQIEEMRKELFDLKMKIAKDAKLLSRYRQQRKDIARAKTVLQEQKLGKR